MMRTELSSSVVTMPKIAAQVLKLRQTVCKVCKFLPKSTTLPAMIKTVAHKGISEYLEKGSKAKLPADLFPKIRRILLLLEAAHAPSDLDLPGSRFHPLVSPYEGFYSVRVNKNWRIIFEWDNDGATNVDLVDYH
jgi:toxin HigB-1